VELQYYDTKKYGPPSEEAMLTRMIKGKPVQGVGAFRDGNQGGL
jgi:hypothetical protein